MKTEEAPMQNPEPASSLREKAWILIMGLAAFLMLYPLLFMFSTSFKDMNQIFQASLNPFSWPPTMANYEVVLEKFPFYQYLGNTLYISVIVTLGKLVTSLLAAFAFVYYEFRGKEKLFSAMLLTFFIPTTVLVMPNYLLMSKMGLLNNPWGVILPELADGMGIFLLRQTMRGIPRALLEASRLDGATSFTILRRIILPLVKPSIFATSIFFFINSWDEYFWPLLILADRDSYTLPLALQMFISAEGGSEWGIAMAVAMFTTLPPLILYLFTQKFILSTFMQSGMKG